VTDERGMSAATFHRPMKPSRTRTPERCVTIAMGAQDQSMELPEPYCRYTAACDLVTQASVISAISDAVVNAVCPLSSARLTALA
jgi:hypothetical protein